VCCGIWTFGCGSASPPTLGGASANAGAGGQGELAAACYPNDTCNFGLACVAGICVAASGAGGSSGASGSAGSAGASGTSGVAGAGLGGSAGAGGAGMAGSSGTGAGGTSGLLFFEDFESGNADRWTVAPPVAWTVGTDGNYVYQQLADSSDAVHWITSTAGDPTWSDVAVEARIKPVMFTSLAGAGVIARFKDDGNFYFAEILADGTMLIRRRTGTTTSASSMTLAGPVTVGAIAGAWCTVKLVVVGSTLSAYFNGALALTVSDATLTSGTIGVGTYRALAEFDDVRVTAAP
jgi:hypothetical protein